LKIDTMPLWLMKPCCMEAPSRTASSPDCRPPLMRASNAFALPPDETPGISRTNVAEERGPELKTRGRSCKVSGAMPSSCEPLS
jgi:hypothetical protein